MGNSKGATSPPEYLTDMEKPLAIDLFCGLGGWAEGFLSEGYRVIGFDIERHDYGRGSYPGQLVLQDARTLHGSQFKDATVIVASPPCQEYSYMAMPWSLAKEKIRKYESGEFDVKKLTELFDTCFRIQREASDEAGRHIPMVVENVRGAQRWVGQARWHFGSYYLWGDVPALMPLTLSAIKVPSFRFDGSGGSFQSASVRRTNRGTGARFTSRDCGIESEHIKVGGIRISEVGFNVAAAQRIDISKKPENWQRSSRDVEQHIGYSRRAASAEIAKIPFPLAQHIARCFNPVEVS